MEQSIYCGDCTGYLGVGNVEGVVYCQDCFQFKEKRITSLIIEREDIR